MRQVMPSNRIKYLMAAVKKVLLRKKERIYGADKNGPRR
jgi:hypothetical protein